MGRLEDAVPSTVAAMLVRPMTADEAVRLAGWRYRDQWSAYDLESPTGVLEELALYRAVVDDADTMVGFVCVGAAARVPGLDADARFIDVGVGMDPDLVGRGSGVAFGEMALGHVAHQHPDLPLRAVIQAWNERSLRVAVRLGFLDVGELIGSRVHYRILIKPASNSPLVTPSGIWLFGNGVMLREFAAADEEAVHSYAGDPIVTRFMEWGPNDVTDTHAFLAGVLGQRSEPDRLQFTLAAVHTASGTVVGSGEFRITDAAHRRGDLGYVIRRDSWSRGYATEVAGLLVRFGFEHLGLRRITATCDPDNHASARVLEKAGLAYEGRMRSHQCVRGVWRDSLLYAIIGAQP
jgi:RimJ/RimL family protein N-acetyltransferase